MNPRTTIGIKTHGVDVPSNAKHAFAPKSVPDRFVSTSIPQSQPIVAPELNSITAIRPCKPVGMKTDTTELLF